jgi:zinc transport system substrate-binding protein
MGDYCLKRRCAIAMTAMLLALPAHGAVAREGPRVLATIKPIHSLVARVMEGVGAPELLIGGAQSEHSYALKPSDARKIEAARLIFEVGPELETYLARPLASLAPGARVIALDRAKGVRRLPARRGGLWEDGSDGDGPSDPHVWLDPDNAYSMADAIAIALTVADPAHAALYARNRTALMTELRAQRKALARKLGPLKGRPYIVFHDAYRYFEARFGLKPIGAVTVAPERPIGPRRLSLLRAAIAKDHVACVFREPQFAPALIENLVEGSDARIGVLDPLGASLAPGPDLYHRLLDNLAASLSACLAKSR